MFRKLLNVLLLANGISTPEDEKSNDNEDKWAEARRKYGERPWEDRRKAAQERMEREHEEKMDDRERD